jgi:hypothetical protein
MTSVEHTLQDWEHERALLSHDIVKNEIIPAVFKLCNVIDGKIEDVEYLANFQVTVIPKISDAICRIEALCSTAELSLSPRQYFDGFPLSGCDRETKCWLPETAHDLWLTSSRLSFRVARLNRELAKLRVAASLIEKVNAGQGIEAARQPAKELRSSVSAVADELSALSTALPYRP